MQILEVDPRSAQEHLKSPDSLYLDVRSVAEFEQGHPKGAWNIPLLHAGMLGMRPNPDFQAVALRVLPKEFLILVGCKSGQRSFMAARTLLDLGYPRVMNVAGGYGGSIEPTTGRVVTPGWMACGLPVSRQSEPGRSWEELRERALT